MNVTDVMLNAIALFDKEEKINSEHYSNGSETGPILDYDVTFDNIIEATYGWTDYEEGETTQVKIIFTSDNIKIEKNTSGSSVMCEFPYDEDSILSFSNEEDFLNWLKDEIQ